MSWFHRPTDLGLFRMEDSMRKKDVEGSTAGKFEDIIFAFTW